MSPDALVGDGKKLEIKNMIVMQVFDIVERPNGKKVIDGRCVLPRKRHVLVCESRASPKVVRADWRKRWQHSLRLITLEHSVTSGGEGQGEGQGQHARPRQGQKQGSEVGRVQSTGQEIVFRVPCLHHS